MIHTCRNTLSWSVIRIISYSLYYSTYSSVSSNYYFINIFIPRSANSIWSRALLHNDEESVKNWSQKWAKKNIPPPCCELSNHRDGWNFWRSGHMRSALRARWRESAAKARWGTHFDTPPNMAYCDTASQGVSVKLISNKGWNAPCDEASESQVDL